MARPTRTEIEEQDQYLLTLWQKFRRAAEVCAEHLARVERVRRVAMFGPAAEPLKKEVPRFREYRRYGIEVYQELHGVDLAVWLTPVDQLQELKRARIEALDELAANERITFAHHQVRMLLFDAATGEYAGWLCDYGSCPKQDQVSCHVPGCGKVRFCQVFTDEQYEADLLAPGRVVPLLIRADARIPVSVRVREMRAEDHAHILNMVESLTEWFDEHARKTAIPMDLKHQRGIVAVIDGQVAGFATLYVAEGKLNIGWLGVRREQHRQGVGRALIEHAAEIAAQLGISELATWTLGDGVEYLPYESTRAFYYANGFEVYQRDKTDKPGCPEAIRIRRKVVPLVKGWDSENGT